MRINKFVALATGMSRRAADDAIAKSRVTINGTLPSPGEAVSNKDIVKLDEKKLSLPEQKTTIILNKPFGYVCSRDGQGSKTIYELLPSGLHNLKPVGRLDKDSSGLLLMTNDGTLAHELTHPSFAKNKTYLVALDKPLGPLHRQMICDHGVQLGDGPSQFIIERHLDGNDLEWQVTMHEGRNRQIRRTFAALGYTVRKLHRTTFHSYRLDNLELGSYTIIS